MISEVVTTSSTNTSGLVGPFRPLLDSTYLGRPILRGLELSRRKSLFYSIKGRSCMRSSPLVHGASIGSKGVETNGSFGVYIITHKRSRCPTNLCFLPQKHRYGYIADFQQSLLALKEAFKEAPSWVVLDWGWCPTTTGTRSPQGHLRPRQRISRSLLTLSRTPRGRQIYCQSISSKPSALAPF